MLLVIERPEEYVKHWPKKKQIVGINFRRAQLSR